MTLVGSILLCAGWVFLSFNFEKFASGNTGILILTILLFVSSFVCFAISSRLSKKKNEMERFHADVEEYLKSHGTSR